MAESNDNSAEKAYAEASAAVKPVKAAEAVEAKPVETKAAVTKPVDTKAVEVKAVEAKPVETKVVEAPKVEAAAKPALKKAAPKKAAAKKRTVKAKAAPKVAAKTPAQKPVPTPAKRAAVKPAAKVAAAKRAARVARRAAAPAPIKVSVPKPTLSELKDKIMTTAKNNVDFTQPMTEALGEIQTRAKVAYEKGTEVVTEVTEFTKGNVEAIVESSKIFAGGFQTLGKTYVEEAKSAYETLTGDVKEMAAVKSPAELFQLQGKLLRRNFDAFVATGSKNTEALLKLANDSFAPLSSRASLAAEKLAKVA